MDKIFILLDTDIGSDIDDAVALSYLLNQPACELVGITTVSGEPHKRASLADAICRAAGRDNIPIHAGVEDPFLIPQHQPSCPQYDALGERWAHREFEKKCTALEFMRHTIRSRPGEITLLAIGPLTNIGLLFAIDPELPAMLRSMMIMGGRFVTIGGGGELLEWNILCDPHAAERVFKAPIKDFTAVGLDVTLQCQMPAEECRTRFAQAGGPLAPVADMAEVWFKHSGAITFHDPLSAALIFEPSICKLQTAHVAVELNSERLLGHTLMLPDEYKPHKIASEVNVQGFFDHYFKVVG